MPNFVKSGKYYYKVNKRDGNKTRISKEEYNKQKEKKKYPNVNNLTKNKENFSKKDLNVNNLTKNKENFSKKDLNVNNLIKSKIKNINKSKLLESISHINFNIVKNGIPYEIYVKLGKCPRFGYYLYNVNVISVDKNKYKKNIYNRIIISHDKNIFNGIL
jgi:hypothetical protein